jgi:hypothetical protein
MEALENGGQTVSKTRVGGSATKIQQIEPTMT